MRIASCGVLAKDARTQAMIATRRTTGRTWLIRRGAPEFIYTMATPLTGKKCPSTTANYVPPIYTELGNNLHSPSEVGVDSFQADRSPTHMYRTAPLSGLWSHAKGGFYHDGRFTTLQDVVEHLQRIPSSRVKPIGEGSLSRIPEVALSSNPKSACLSRRRPRARVQSLLPQ
jgi:hypothetical protein